MKAVAVSSEPKPGRRLLVLCCMLLLWLVVMVMRYASLYVIQSRRHSPCTCTTQTVFPMDAFSKGTPKRTTYVNLPPPLGICICNMSAADVFVLER
jgi:hypothetical protein